MFYWHILQLHISVCMLVNLCSTEPSALSSLLQMHEPEADNADCATQNISVLNRSIVLCYCDSLRNTEQQRVPNGNPGITSAVEAVLRGCKWVEGLFWNCHLNWRFGHTGAPLIAMNAWGPLEGQETLLNHVGKQKIKETDVVLSSSWLNLIICFLISSIYLMKCILQRCMSMQVIFLILFLVFILLRHAWTSHSGKKNCNSELKKSYQV